MKTKPILIASITVTMLLTCLNMGVAGEHLEPTVNAITVEVPDEVMREFESTFVYDDEGQFIGARVDMLRPFLNNAQIIDLVSPFVGAKDVLYEGYKPKTPRGCKKNNKWICVLRGIDVIH